MSGMRSSAVATARVSITYPAVRSGCPRCYHQTPSGSKSLHGRRTLAQRLRSCSSPAQKPIRYLPIRLNSSTNTAVRPLAAQKAQERLRPLLDHLPSNIDWGVAYGSGVIHQANAASAGVTPMTDLLISTPDPLEFHEENLRINPYHYPLWARVFGARSIAWMQGFGAEMWYVTMVQLEGLEVKYGVISTERLVRDLETWSTLYVAGRLHKPVLTLKTTPPVEEAEQTNLRSALSIALLQLPSTFTEVHLWEQIAGISYSGDPRMSVPGAENPLKVKNIVRGPGAIAGFREVYLPALKELGSGLRWEAGGSVVNGWRGAGEEGIVRDGSVNITLLFESLPPRVHTALRTQIPDYDSLIHKAASGHAPADNPQFQKILASVLKDIILRPALVQSLKGLVTAGPTKSVYYSLAKFRKWLYGRGAKKPQ